MEHLAILRIFADHYQFWVHESDANPFDPLPNYTDESVQRGWSRTNHAISFSTHAHLNDHRLDIYRNEDMPLISNYERCSVHHLKVRSGISVFDTEEIFQLPLTPGDYSLVLAAYNLGKEQDPDEEELGDKEFLDQLHWERYELYVCPKLEQPEGLVNDS